MANGNNNIGIYDIDEVNLKDQQQDYPIDLGLQPPPPLPAVDTGVKIMDPVYKEQQDMANLLGTLTGQKFEISAIRRLKPNDLKILREIGRLAGIFGGDMDAALSTLDPASLEQLDYIARLIPGFDTTFTGQPLSGTISQDVAFSDPTVQAYTQQMGGPPRTPIELARARSGQVGGPPRTPIELARARSGQGGVDPETAADFFAPEDELRTDMPMPSNYVGDFIASAGRYTLGMLGKQQMQQIEDQTFGLVPMSLRPVDPALGDPAGREAYSALGDPAGRETYPAMVQPDTEKADIADLVDTDFVLEPGGALGIVGEFPPEIIPIPGLPTAASLQSYLQEIDPQWGQPGPGGVFDMPSGANLQDWINMSPYEKSIAARDNTTNLNYLTAWNKALDESTKEASIFRATRNALVAADQNSIVELDEQIANLMEPDPADYETGYSDPEYFADYDQYNIDLAQLEKDKEFREKRIKKSVSELADAEEIITLNNEHIVDLPAPAGELVEEGSLNIGIDKALEARLTTLEQEIAALGTAKGLDGDKIGKEFTYAANKALTDGIVDFDFLPEDQTMDPDMMIGLVESLLSILKTKEDLDYQAAVWDPETDKIREEWRFKEEQAEASFDKAMKAGDFLMAIDESNKLQEYRLVQEERIRDLEEQKLALLRGEQEKEYAYREAEQAIEEAEIAKEYGYREAQQAITEAEMAKEYDYRAGQQAIELAGQEQEYQYRLQQQQVQQAELDLQEQQIQSQQAIELFNAILQNPYAASALQTMTGGMSPWLGNLQQTLGLQVPGQQGLQIPGLAPIAGVTIPSMGAFQAPGAIPAYQDYPTTLADPTGVSYADLPTTVADIGIDPYTQMPTDIPLPTDISQQIPMADPEPRIEDYPPGMEERMVYEQDYLAWQNRQTGPGRSLRQLFPAGIPTIGALGETDPEALRFLEALLGLQGVSAEQFGQRVRAITPQIRQQTADGAGFGRLAGRLGAGR